MEHNNSVNTASLSTGGDDSLTQTSSEPKIDRPNIVLNLLNTLNTHLNVDGDSVAMDLYSEPQDSDKMKVGISGSHVLANYVLK